MSPLDRFIATLATPLAQGRARTALTRAIRVNGVEMQRRAWAESAAGAVRFDDAKQRAYTRGDVFFSYGDIGLLTVAYAKFLALAS